MYSPRSQKAIALPEIPESRLTRAIAAFISGDNSATLRSEFESLVNIGEQEANYYLGMIHEDGTNGVEKNLLNALFYYEKSAEGCGFVQGHLAVARMFYHGLGVDQDYNKAYIHYWHVAQGTENPVAAFMLGRMYHHGQCVPKSLSLARQWYGRAISFGSVYGLLNLAMLEAEEGRWIPSLILRLKAGWNAFRIARKDPADPRLRGG